MIRSFWIFLADIFRDRNLLWGLGKNDLKSRFAASFLGSAWAIVQPLVTILVFWFVFQAGFRNPPRSGVPFIIWFAPAYLSWCFFSEALSSGTNSLMEYSYLVKKVKFRVSTVPLVKILSSMFIHTGFIVFIFFMLIVSGVPLSIYNIQVFYYFFCTCVLLVGLCWCLSAIAPFVKDTVNIVNVFLQIGFWITPIFWSPDEMTVWVQMLLKLNPMFYICRGYRDSFVDHVWFWQRGNTNLFFWVVTVAVFFFGANLFHKLRPQFADVL